MNWPQIIIIGWFMTALGYDLAQHGKPKTGKTSFWITAIVVATLMLVLWCGGFFKVLS